MFTTILICSGIGGLILSKFGFNYFDNRRKEQKLKAMMDKVIK